MLCKAYNWNRYFMLCDEDILTFQLTFNNNFFKEVWLCLKNWFI